MTGCADRPNPVAGPGSGEEVLRAALTLALLAPSVHNCQPWRWLVGPGTAHLHADGSRQVPATDPHGRDLLISCGAALDHLLVALASLGRGARVRRMPRSARPGHLAVVEPFAHPATASDEVLAASIPLRRTDRRRFSSWPNATLLLLTTPTDSALDRLRAGEATSAILLTATRLGLASSPLTQPLEVDDTREFVRRRVANARSSHPQILLRIGWAPTGSADLPPTPRRPLHDVVASLDA